MKVEQFIALRGKGGNGTARISTDEKSTEIELVMRSKSAQPLTAYLVTDRGTVPVPLVNNRHGVTRCDSNIKAVLIACNEDGTPGFILAGTAMGAHINIDEAMRDIRMRSAPRPSAAKTDIGKSGASVLPSGAKTAANSASPQTRTPGSADRTAEATTKSSGARHPSASGGGALRNASVKNTDKRTESAVSSVSKDTGGRTANAGDTAAVRSSGKASEYETLNANSRAIQGGTLKNPSSNNTAKKAGQSQRAQGNAGAGASGGPNVSNPAVNRGGNSPIDRSWQSSQTQGEKPLASSTEPALSDGPLINNTGAGAKPAAGGPAGGGGDDARNAPQPPALHPDQMGHKGPIESSHNETGNGRSGESSVLNEILKRADVLFHTPVQPAKTGNNKREIPRRVAASGVREEVPVYNPFPDAFPRSVWKRVLYPGTSRYYLEGEVVKDGARYMVHALPGEYGAAMQRGNGFSRFMRAADGTGYWLRIRRI